MKLMRWYLRSARSPNRTPSKHLFLSCCHGHVPATESARVLRTPPRHLPTRQSRVASAHHHPASGFLQTQDWRPPRHQHTTHSCPPWLPLHCSSLGLHCWKHLLRTLNPGPGSSMEAQVTDSRDRRRCATAVSHPTVAPPPWVCRVKSLSPSETCRGWDQGGVQGVRGL